MSYPTHNAPAPRRRRVWPWIVGGIILVLLCAGGMTACLGGTAKVIGDEQASRVGDITIGACNHEDAIDAVTIHYTIVNSGEQARGYMPNFTVKAPDGTIVGSASDITPEVAPGAKYKGTTSGTVSQHSGKITCVVAEA